MAKPDRIFASELEGREVMDLRAGEVIGAVTDFCLTRDGIVTHIGVLPLQWYRGGKGIAPGAVTNITRERVSIEDSTLLEEFAPNSDELLSYTFDSVMGKEVLQQDGELLGALADFAFDLGDGRITDVVVFGEEAEGKRQKIAVQSIQTIGRNYVVVSRAGAAAEVSPGPKMAAPSVVEDAAASTAVVELADEAPEAVAFEPEVAEPEVIAELETPAMEIAAPAPVEISEPEIEDFGGGGAATADEPLRQTDTPGVVEEASAPYAPEPEPTTRATGQLRFNGGSSAVADQRAGIEALKLSALDRRKAEFLLGKSAHRDIATEDGELLIERGAPFDGAGIAQLAESGLLTEVFIEMTSYRA